MMDARTELTRLQAEHFPRLSWRNLFIVHDEAPLTPEDLNALYEYFSRFLEITPGEVTVRAATPEREETTVFKYQCVCCGHELGGFFGSLSWGIANGEAYCGRCHYPVRVYHRKVGPLEFCNLPLQYHPDELNMMKKETSGHSG